MIFQTQCGIIDWLIAKFSFLINENLLHIPTSPLHVFMLNTIFTFSFPPKKNTVLFKYFLYLPGILFAIEIHSSHLVFTRRRWRRLWYVFMNRKQSRIRFLFQADLTGGKTHPVSRLFYSVIAFDWKPETTRLYENMLLVNVTCEVIKKQRQLGVWAERSNDVKFVKHCSKLRNQITELVTN